MYAFARISSGDAFCDAGNLLSGWFVFDSPSTGPLLGFLATGLCKGWCKEGDSSVPILITL